MTTTTRSIFTDEDRTRVRAFFDKYLEDSTAFKIPTRREDRELGIPSRIRVIEDDAGDIVAALFASGDPFDVVAWRQRGQFDVADVVANQMLMIHEVAVHPAARRQGFGEKLVKLAVDDATASNASIVTLVYDDRTPGLASFYTQLGFRSFPRGEMLELEFASLPGLTIGFPQDEATFRWATRVISRERVRGA